jgi:diguanylate cyclase (GGDEF)-like protein/PAS domain S-box-containing protein
MLDTFAQYTPGVFYQFLMTKNRRFRFLQISDRFTAMCGVPVSALLQDANELFQYLRAGLQEDLLNNLLQSGRRGTEFCFCLELLTPDGRDVWLEARSAPETQGNGDTIWTGFVYDVTAREQALRQLAKSSSLAKTILDNMLDSVVNIDDKGLIIYANQTALTLFGYQQDELIGRNVSCLMGSHHAREHDGYLQHFAQTRETRIIGTNRVVEARHRDQTPMPVELRICELETDSGRTYLGVMRDLRHKLMQQQAIDQLTLQDTLTGLPNRTALIRRLNQCIDDLVIQQRQFCLICVDADDFKLINEGYGFDYADEFLRKIAQILLDLPDAFLARTGEDEFAVLLDSPVSASLMEAQVANIQQLIGKPQQVFGSTISCSFTAGAFVFATADLTYSDVMRNAELALNYAKSNGKGGLAFHDHHVDNHIRRTALLDQSLKSPDILAGFFLVYQPQYDVAGRLIGFEALMRWNNQGQLVPPDQFIPLAERNGTIYMLGQWLLAQACDFIKATEHHPHLAQCRVSVNISARQFASRHFVDDVLKAVRAGEISPSRLHLELTERLLLENPNDVVAKMQQLSQAGITFSLDDFGTGYSSLAYLKQLPLHELKIDKSFVRDLPGSESDRSIVSAILLMASGLNLQVIAEGVETEQHRRALQLLGCRLFQGYLFGRPERAEYWLDPANPHSA